MWSVTLKGQRFDFYYKTEYARLTGEAVSTIEKDKKHPARIKIGGRVLYCPQVAAIKMLSIADVDLPDWSDGDLMKASDFTEDVSFELIPGGKP